MRDFKQNQFWLNPDLAIHESSQSLDAVIVSRGDRHFRVQGFPMQVLLAIGKDKQPVAAIALKALGDNGPESLEQVYAIICRLQERGLVYSDWVARRDGSTEILPEPKRRKPIDFIWRQKVLPAAFVSVMARPLVPLLNGAAMSIAIPLMIALQIWFLATHSALLNPRAYIARLDASMFAILAAANYTALFLHELGHAAGCLRAGVRNGGIGICIYIMFPGLFTEVTESWKLPGKKRLIVDSAGIYVSLCAATLSMAAFFVTGNPVAAAMVLLCDITTLVNLNPFVRMDGYWIISDLLEMPHLMDMNKATTSVLLSCIIFRRRLALPRVPSVVRWSQYLYYGYYLFFLCSIIYLGTLTAIHVVPYLVRHYPPLVIETVRTLRNSPFGWHVVKALIGFLMASVTVVSLLVLAGRLVMFFVRLAANIRAAGAEAARAAARESEQQPSSCVPA
jgi:putative peptide zinc metalloprotease protein